MNSRCTSLFSITSFLYCNTLEWLEKLTRVARKYHFSFFFYIEKALPATARSNEVAGSAQLKSGTEGYCIFQSPSMHTMGRPISSEVESA